MTSSEPGWNADPAGAAGTYRWWDGTGWTEWMTEDPNAEPPAAAEGVVGGDAPGDQAPVEQGPSSASAPSTKDYPAGYEPKPKAATTEEAASSGTAANTAAAPATGLRHALRGPRLLGLIAVIVAVIVVIAVVVYGNRTPPDPLALPTQPASSGKASVDPSLDSPAPSIAKLDEKSGKITVGSFTASLPGKPYTYDSNVLNYPPMLSAGVLANAPVSVKYDGEHTWFAALAIGELDPEVVAKGDAKKTADQVFAGLVSINFSDFTTTTGTISTKPVTLAGAQRAATASGRVSYQVAGLASHYDQVSVLVVQLKDGTWAGWMSSRPDNASSQVKKALQSSIDSIKAN